MYNHDTICALSTAPGGAIAVVRMSGERSLDIINDIFYKAQENLQLYHIKEAKANTVHYGCIAPPASAGNGARGLIDDVLVSIFRAPHSYTGEDSVEIGCHGSRYIINKVLGILVSQGCRMASPGEYTMRAYLNGKMDLSQAEAVADLISSTNKASHQMALSQLRGDFSSELSLLRDQLLRLVSLLELELDFSDHEELEFANRSELLELAQTIDTRIVHLVQSFEVGQALKQGIPVAIVGKTNAGKSTLLNRLLKDERAIVSDIHGTTRDTIEDVLDINGVSFRIIDTAGLRDTADVVEQIGIDRTYQAIHKARIVLWVIDAIPTIHDIEEMKRRTQGKSVIVVRNKMDIQEMSLPAGFMEKGWGDITISAKKGINIQTLEDAIFSASNVPELADGDVIVTSVRHYEALTKAHQDIRQVIDGLQNQLYSDLLSEDLHLVLADLAEITGRGIITSQETLNNIFSHFCVGK